MENEYSTTNLNKKKPNKTNCNDNSDSNIFNKLDQKNKRRALSIDSLPELTPDSESISEPRSIELCEF